MGVLTTTALLCLVLALPQAPAMPSSPATATTTTTMADATGPQELVWLNARLAMREGRSVDVLKLWLLRNALVDQGHAPIHDVDFRSLVWAALGEGGYCPDGFIDDEDGAGLWPLAVHNWLVKNQRRQPPSAANAWTAFSGGLQARPVSLFDVLDREELKSVRFARGACLVHRLIQPQVLATGAAVQWVDMDDRLSVGLLLRDAIRIAETTLDPDLVEGRAVLTTRLFDLDVALTRLQAAKARRETSLLEQALREAGVTPGGRLELAKKREQAFGRSAAAALWRTAMAWPASEWLALREDRRLSLFADADVGLKDVVDAGARDGLVVDVADALIARGEGAALSRWLGFAGTPPSRTAVADEAPAPGAELVAIDERTRRLREAIVLGERGERLLALDDAAGFRDRSVVALHRGVHFLGAGDTIAALRSFAFALARAEEGSDPETVHRLSRRWLAFVLSQYATTDEVVAVVERFVPVTDWGVVVDSLVWRAAFHQDPASFALVCDAATRKKAGAVRRTCEQLQPLVQGAPATMWQKVAEGGDGALVRFAERLVDELSTEPLDVRHNQQQTLQGTIATLDDVAARSGNASKKRLDLVRRRAQALLDGVAAFDDSVRGRSERAAPDAAAYAGSVRLAPADPLPWPFARPAPTPPNPFLPLVLRPVERVEDGERRFRWSIAE